MSALEYMLLDQCSSKKWASAFPARGSGYDKSVELVNINKHISAVVENEFKHKVERSKSRERSHSAIQTDPVDGVDFDWDLSDKNDSETQTRNPSSNYSSDAVVQTDQRIVFKSNGAKQVSFQHSGGTNKSEDSHKSSRKHSSSQTRWGHEAQDKDCQVKPSDFGQVTRKQGWRKNRRRHHDHHAHITQNFVPFKPQNRTKKVTISNNNDLIEELEVPATHKSSIAVHKARLDKNQNLDLSYHVGVQTDHDPESSVSYQDTYKSEIYSEDPAFFHTVDVHVIEEVSSRWYKSVKKLVKHIQQIIPSVPQYQARADLVTVRGIFVWVAENIMYDPSLSDSTLETVDILRDKVGARKDFVKIFSELCQAADIKNKVITGFIKDDQYKPSEFFDKRKSSLESWLVVRIENDWRLIDPLLGAGLIKNSIE